MPAEKKPINSLFVTHYESSLEEINDKIIAITDSLG